MKKANLSCEEISQSIHVNLLGGLISSSMAYPSCVVSICGDDFVANPMVIPLPIFDMILGMNWLHHYRAVKSFF